jgi:hypothetical protein
MLPNTLLFLNVTLFINTHSIFKVSYFNILNFHFISSALLLLDLGLNKIVKMIKRFLYP